MGVAITLDNYLKTKDVEFDIVQHPYTEGSFNTALCANIPAEALIKGVVFRDEDFHYTMAVIPASNRVLRHTLNQVFDRHLVLADEDELNNIFFDCEQGAIPSFGQAYGLNVIWDDQLLERPDFWLEAGDHEHLIHLANEDFQRLMQSCLHDRISGHRH
jgi:Ala-tRNA(Pro) deacylase